MENRLRMRISRMFRSSFGSCRTRKFTDVMEKAVFNVPQNYSGFETIEPSSPSLKARPFPSICKPKWPETTKPIKDSLPRPKVSDRSSPFFWGSLDGRPSRTPASPISSPSHPDEKFKTLSQNKMNMKKKNENRRTHMRSNNAETFPCNSSSLDKSFGSVFSWHSSDEDYEGEDETDTLISSRTFSSDSSESFRRRRRRSVRRRSTNRNSKMGVLPLEGKVKDTFAVVKRSSDPYNDFRTSMVEMIVEKQIFAPKDLENLLECFLSLNSYRNHKIIVEVFAEILEALFSNCS